MIDHKLFVLAGHKLVALVRHNLELRHILMFVHRLEQLHTLASVDFDIQFILEKVNLDSKLVNQHYLVVPQQQLPKLEQLGLSTVLLLIYAPYKNNNKRQKHNSTIKSKKERQMS